jgi:hypothetical protein
VKLLNCILTALVVGIVSCWIIAIYIAAQPEGTDLGLYAFIMIFGNTIIPIFLTACLFAVFKKNINPSNRLVKYFAQAGLALAIMAIGVCLMTISQAMSYYGMFSGLAPANLRERFDDSYR